MTRDERALLARCVERLEAIEEYERRHAQLLGAVLDLVDVAINGQSTKPRQRQLTGQARHLRLVREE